MVTLCEFASARSKSRADYDLALVRYEATMVFNRYRTSGGHAKVTNLVNHPPLAYSIWAAALEKRRTRKLGFSEALLDHIVTDPKMCAAMVPSDTRDAALPPTILAEFLKLNRSDLDEAPLQAAKTALIEEAA
jgi:hypothetical protein